MTWNPLMRDAKRLAELEGSQFDFVVSDVVRYKDQAVGGRERIVALRALAEGVMNGTHLLDDLLDTIEDLEDAQRAASDGLLKQLEKFKEEDKTYLQDCSDAFLTIADALVDMLAVAETENHTATLGRLAIVEEKVAELDVLLDSRKDT